MLVDPELYRLTLPDGRVFVLGKAGGLQSLNDANGNQLVVSPGGILHSSGAGVTFTRDGEGRITRITDPAGFFTAYSYDASGDLVAATDRDGHTTTYAYSATRPHFLEAITDPLGRRPIRNDALGNQIAVTDARGNVTTYEHDALNRRTKTIFPDGTFALTAYDAPRPK